MLGPIDENQGQKNLAFMLWQGKNVMLQVNCKRIYFGDYRWKAQQGC